MHMATQKKIETVEKLTEKIKRAKAIVLVDYRGLKHKQFEELRKLLKKLQAELVVAKNRLFKRAMEGKSKELDSFLTDPTATLFAYADEVSPIKELLKFFKTAGFGKAKAGLLGTQLLSDTEVTRFASLPAREILLAQLAGQLNAPIQKLHYALSWNINRFARVLNAVKEKKTN